ncbi:TIGR01620 family protein [Rheinheimera sp. SA_1]|uniref:TIGR01620 family protein n=1 Tax=Rheinheimera sp. SA_1 TaxID=1827365 RepID=UPI0009EE6F41|nr:TIGR01620 family protein [Rheinheimera sp. SA_1]
MNDLKKTTAFSEADFVSLQPKLQQNEAAALAGKLQQAQEFTTEQFKVEINEAPVAETAESRRGLWLWGGALLSLTAVAGVQWWQFMADSWQSGLLQGTAVTALTGLSALLLARFGYREWRLRRQLKMRQQWREKSFRLQQSMQFGEAYPMCQQMISAMSDTSHSDWQHFEQQRKAEFTDAELLQLFDLTVLTNIDKTAELQIRQAAMQTGVAVALSPFALADMLLVLWRGALMLRELSVLYGAPVGKLRSLAMMKQFVKTVFFTGAAEIAVDVGADLVGAELSGRLSARLGQGVLAGVMVARLGRFAQQQLRPLPGAISDKSLVKQVLTDLVKRLAPGATAN